MSIQEKIKDEIKQAMLAKDTVRLSVVRGLTASFVNETIAKGVPALSDDDALSVIRRAVKQRKDSIEQFGKGGRPDLVAAETAELKILETYLPKMMSLDDIRAIAKKKMTELGIKAGDKSAAGKFTGAVMKELKGKADGADVKAVVEKLLA